jgi:multisubunit Na+/H+ antiporter MnhB subunit
VNQYSVILANVVRYAFWVLITYAAVLFVKGHNAPGGGFIAGLLVAVAIVLRYVTWDLQKRPRAGSAQFVTVAAVGLAISILSAAVPVFLGYPFFTQTFGFVHVPLLGEVELASASIFDLGVATVVVGNVAAVISAMTERE